MDSNISASDLDQDFFFGPVTQRELIITWKRRRQEKLKKQQAEALKNEDDATKTASVDSEEPDLKKSRVQTTEQKSSTTAGDQLSANTSDSNETGNIESGQPVDEAQSSFHSVDLSISKTCGEVTENVTEAQVSLLLETHQSSNILAAADEQSGDVSAVVESAPSIVDHVETQSKDTSNRNPEVSINDISCEINESVFEPATSQELSLEPEAHRCGNIQIAADEKDEQLDEASGISESAPSIVDHVETQSKETSNRNPELSINDISCEINESVFEPATSQELSLEPEAHRCGNIQTAADERDEQLDEASGISESTQPVANLGETKSKDSSYCSADLSKGEICDDIVQSVATPQVSLEPEALQAGNLSASDEHEADDETGICEKFMDESDQPIDTQSKETSFYSADLSINEMCAVINESVAESTSEQKVFLDLEAHQSGNLQNPADDQSRNCEIPVAGHHKPDLLNRPSEAYEALVDQENNKENGPVHLSSVKAEDRGSAKPPASGILTPSDGSHSGIPQSVETVYKSNIRKPSIIKPATLNVDPSTLKVNTSWAKRFNPSKIPKPKIPYYVQPLDKK